MTDLVMSTHAMVQLPDLVVSCAKKFHEVEGGYRPGWSDQARKFYAECYDLIDSRVQRKGVVQRRGRGMDHFNNTFETIRSGPIGQWRRRYQL